MRVASGTPALPYFDSIEYKTVATFQIPLRKVASLAESKKSKKAPTVEPAVSVSVDTNAVARTMAPISVPSAEAEEPASKKSKKSKKATSAEMSIEEKYIVIYFVIHHLGLRLLVKLTLLQLVILPLLPR